MDSDDDKSSIDTFIGSPSRLSLDEHAEKNALHEQVFPVNQSLTDGNRADAKDGDNCKKPNSLSSAVDRITIQTLAQEGKALYENLAQASSHATSALDTGMRVVDKLQTQLRKQDVELHRHAELTPKQDEVQNFNLPRQESKNNANSDTDFTEYVQRSLMHNPEYVALQRENASLKHSLLEMQIYLEMMMEKYRETMQHHLSKLHDVEPDLVAIHNEMNDRLFNETAKTVAAEELVRNVQASAIKTELQLFQNLIQERCEYDVRRELLDASLSFNGTAYINTGRSSEPGSNNAHAINR